MNKKIFITLTGIIIVLILAYYFLPSVGGVPLEQNPVTLAGIQTSNAPWIAEKTYLRKRLEAIGLPALKAEGEALHLHQHIDIFIAGRAVVVPADIGVNEAEGFISPIHIHDDTAIIHIESPTIQTFNLGQFFDVWGVVFTKNSLGSYQNNADKVLRVFVNGIEIKTDPRLIALEARQQIVVTYGTEAELPKPMPATYQFAPGL